MGYGVIGPHLDHKSAAFSVGKIHDF